VRVLGTGEQLTEIARATGATTLVVAIARADAQMLRRIADLASPSGLKVHVLPHFDEIIAGRSRIHDLRDLSIDDLIGRHPVDMQVETVVGYLAGKRVLVTGAGGSIGSELCRQISRYGPGELIMLDRDETGLQQTQLSIQGNGLLDDDSVVLADIRDAARISALLADRRPDVVFHAAALKHLPMLEMYPDEAWKTNVVGTLNVLDAALAAGVQTFVNISTDKAAFPTSVLGHSKRIAERLTAGVAASTGLRYLSVRFGNVLGSRGSLIPTFTALIEAGGPLTVTHPDATRFFMTIPEACQLVLQAGAIGKGGEALILDMGEPVRILDIANRMIEMSQKDVTIVFTGLRRGEKLHEDLVGEGEQARPTSHPQITLTRVDGVDAHQLPEVRATWLDATASTYESPA
jgi:dTDP-glucose 4,6-dehydratase